jgi:hypothetical protein
MQQVLTMRQELNLQQQWALMKPWMVLCVIAAQTALWLGCPETEKRIKEEEGIEEKKAPGRCQVTEVPQIAELERGMQNTMEKNTLVDFRDGAGPQRFGESRIGVIEAQKNEARLSVSYPVANASRNVRMIVCGGDIVPMAGKLHRIVSIHYVPNIGPPGYVGGSQSYVTIDSTSIELEGLQLHSNSLAIPLDASTKTETERNKGYNIELLELTDSTAKLEVWPNQWAKPHTKPELIKTHSVKAGDTLTLGSLQLTVLSVVPSNPQTSLRGFVEIGF